MLVQELKGNIRVFCRVRPLVAHDALMQSAAVDQLLQFPSSGPDPLCYTMRNCLLVLFKKSCRACCAMQTPLH